MIYLAKTINYIKTIYTIINILTVKFLSDKYSKRQVFLPFTNLLFKYYLFQRDLIPFQPAVKLNEERYGLRKIHELTVPLNVIGVSEKPFKLPTVYQISQRSGLGQNVAQTIGHSL